MNQSEKRFFKLYSNLYNSKKEKHYIILFELYEKQKEYDEKEIKQELSKVAGVGNINVLRRYLKEQILTSLKLFHRKENNLNKHDELQSSILLISKGFYLEAEKILNKLIKTSIEEEDFNFVLICLTKLINIKEYTGYDSFDSLNTVYKLNHKRAHFLALYEEYLEVQNIFREVKRTIYDKDLFQNLSKKLLEILENDLLPLEKKLKSVKSKFVFYYTKSYIYYNLSDQKNNIKELEKIEQLLLDKPNIIKPLNRSSIIVNLSFHYISTGQKEKYFEKKKVLENFIKVEGKHQRLILYWKYILSYDFYYKNLDEKAPKDLNKKLLELTQSKKVSFSDQQRIALQYRLARYSFFNGDIETTTKTLNSILVNHKIDWGNYYFLSIHFLLLISYVETKNVFSFKQEYSFLKRKIDRENIEKDPLNDILKQIAKLMKSDKNESKALSKLKTIIKKNKKDLLFGIKIEFIAIWAQFKLDQTK